MKFRSRIPGLARLAAPLVAALLLAAAGPAWAVDGVLEINQTCATQTGCFAGDTAGFPVDIGASGSYRLTSNLSVPLTSLTAIDIGAGRVNLDLNGFTVSCGPGCTGTGATLILGRGDLTSVSNGIVERAANAGIDLQGVGSSVDRVTVVSSAGPGISAGSGCRVTNSIVRGGSVGILVLDDCQVQGNVVSFSGDVGISTGRATVADNSVRESGSHGIQSTGPASISGNTVWGSQGSGIYCTANGCRITGNAVWGCSGSGIQAEYSVLTENTSHDNGGAGLDAYASSVVANTAFQNTSFGLLAGGSTGYGSNQFDGNNGGNLNPQVGGGGPEIGTNVCGGDTTCP